MAQLKKKILSKGHQTGRGTSGFSRERRSRKNVVGNSRRENPQREWNDGERPHKIIDAWKCRPTVFERSGLGKWKGRGENDGQRNCP